MIGLYVIGSIHKGTAEIVFPTKSTFDSVMRWTINDWHLSFTSTAFETLKQTGVQGLCQLMMKICEILSSLNWNKLLHYKILFNLYWVNCIICECKRTWKKIQIGIMYILGALSWSSSAVSCVLQQVLWLSGASLLSMEALFSLSPVWASWQPICLSANESVLLLDFLNPGAAFVYTIRVTLSSTNHLLLLLKVQLFFLTC